EGALTGHRAELRRLGQRPRRDDQEGGQNEGPQTPAQTVHAPAHPNRGAAPLQKARPGDPLGARFHSERGPDSSGSPVCRTDGCANPVAAAIAGSPSTVWAGGGPSRRQSSSP